MVLVHRGIISRGIETSVITMSIKFPYTYICFLQENICDNHGAWTCRCNRRGLLIFFFCLYMKSVVLRFWSKLFNESVWDIPFLKLYFVFVCMIVILLLDASVFVVLLYCFFFLFISWWHLSGVSFLQGKRGIEKQPFHLPDFIAATGIEKIRQVKVILYQYKVQVAKCFYCQLILVWFLCRLTLRKKMVRN